MSNKKVMQLLENRSKEYVVPLQELRKNIAELANPSVCQELPVKKQCAMHGPADEICFRDCCEIKDNCEIYASNICNVYKYAEPCDSCYDSTCKYPNECPIYDGPNKCEDGDEEYWDRTDI